MRSSKLMSPADTALLVVDVQERLLAVMKKKLQQMLLANVGRLLDGAQVLGTRTFATEQYPQGLGPTHAELAVRLEHPLEKLTFSCCGVDAIPQALCEAGLQKVCLAGMETHVCIQQTALDLLANDFQVYVPVDAVISRRKLDWRIALERLRQAGVVVTTTEAVLFEWCERAGTAQFKQILELVK